MAIKVTCSACGKTFSVKDELAGKTGKCPCGAALKVPVPQPAAPAAPAAPAQMELSLIEPSLAAPSLSGPAPEADGSAPGQENKCPECGAPAATGAVLCVQCGYNFKTKQRLGPPKVGGQSSSFFKLGAPGAGRIVQIAVAVVCALFLLGAAAWGYTVWAKKNQFKRRIAQLHAPVKYATFNVEATDQAAAWANDYYKGSELWKVYFSHQAASRQAQSPFVKIHIDLIRSNVPGHKGYTGKDISFSPGSVTAKVLLTDLDANKTLLEESIEKGLPLVIVVMGKEPGPLDDSFRETENQVLAALGDKLDLTAMSLFKADESLREIVVLGLLEKVKGNNTEISESAAKALGAMGPDAKSAIPELVNQMAHPSQKVKNASAEALGRIGGDGVTNLIAALQSDNKNHQALGALAFKQMRNGTPETVRAIIPLLKSQDSMVRSCACRALGNFGSVSKDAVFALREALKDEESKVRCEVLYAIREIGPDAKDAIPDLIAKLSDADMGVREQAAIGLQKFGADAVPLLVQATKDENIDIAMSSVQLLGTIKPVEESTIRAMAEAMENKDSGVRFMAANTLGEQGTEAAKASFPALAATMKDPTKEVRYAAYRSLEKLQPGPEVLIPAMMKAYEVDKGPAGDFRVTLVDALANTGKKDPEFISFFIQALLDDSKDVRFHALRALELVQPDPRRLASGLVESYRKEKDSQGDYRQTVIDHLGELGVKTPEVMAVLLSALKEDPAKDTRLSGFTALQKMGVDAVPYLIEGYKTDKSLNGEFRLAMVDLVAASDVKEKEVVDLFLQGLMDEVKDVRMHACQGLEKVKPDPKKIIPSMIEAYKKDKEEGEGDFRAAMVNSVGAFRLKDNSIIKFFILALNDNRPFVRKDAAKHLGRMGISAREALPGLRKALKDGNDELVGAAKQAIDRIEGKAKIPAREEEE